MRISLEVFGRRRKVLSVAGSLAAHLLLLAALVWVRPPSTDVSVKRGEPLFVELRQADEQAERGLPGSPTPAPALKPVPPVAKPAPAPRPAPASPAPPVVAKAAPEPEPVTPPPAPLAPAAAPGPATAAPPATAEAPAQELPSQAREAPPGPTVAAVPPAPPETGPDIRAALRSGGGAGGFGQGRRGMYGEPVPNDTKDPRYADYISRVGRMIEGKWFYPCPDGNPIGLDCTRREGQLLAEVGIAKNGELSYLILLNSSGSLNMDESALTAVKLAAPFPPVPDSVGARGFPIVFTMRYVLVGGSLMNLLH